MNEVCLQTDLGTQDCEDKREENATSAILWNSSIMSNTVETFTGISIHLLLYIAVKI